MSSDGLTRRTLIIGTVGLAAAACGSDDDAEPGLAGSPRTAPETTTTVPATASDADLPTDPVNGYVVCTLTSDECRADYVAVEDVWNPASPAVQVASYQVGRGETAATPVVG